SSPSAWTAPALVSDSLEGRSTTPARGSEDRRRADVVLARLGIDDLLPGDRIIWRVPVAIGTRRIVNDEALIRAIEVHDRRDHVVGGIPFPVGPGRAVRDELHRERAGLVRDPGVAVARDVVIGAPGVVRAWARIHGAVRWVIALVTRVGEQLSDRVVSRHPDA